MLDKAAKIFRWLGLQRAQGFVYSLSLLKFDLQQVIGIAVIRAKNHKRQRRKSQSVTAKREKSQTPKVLTAILTLPNLT